jgi:hypothetical protein
MDPRRFDRFAKALSGRLTRRTALTGGGLAAALLGARGSAGAPAAQDASPAASAASQPEVFTLYMSPYGSDSASGLTMREAVPTLNEVQKRLEKHKPDMDVEVRILHVCDKPYMGQTVEWTHTSPTHTISFMPSDYQHGAGIYEISGRPVFDGDGSPDYLFWLESKSGEKTNIAFYYLQMQHYTKGGIALVGSREDSEGWNGYNTVYGCYFYLLGNKHTGKTNGYGGIHTWNSKYNTIENNHFVALEGIGNNCDDNPENDTPDPTPCGPHIHGVYLAHRSDYNLVTNNRFRVISGDPIRVRNYSNYNRILANTFEQTGVDAFISDWHGDCECRSWENEFCDNTPLACGYAGETIPLFESLEGDNPEGPDCPALSRRVWTNCGNDSSLCGPTPAPIRCQPDQKCCGSEQNDGTCIGQCVRDDRPCP